MTGDPNQKNPPSIFRFEAYPGSSNTSQWDSTLAQSKYMNFPVQTESSVIYSRLINQQLQYPFPAQIPSTFSFGGQQSVNPFQCQVQRNSDVDGTMKQILGKRKTDSPPLQPYKQHITEEKMAEHMSKLHISSETASSPLEPESVKNKRLYMCEEMRKLRNDPIIPPSLVSGIQRPCTALVLWQPPLRILPCLASEPNINLDKEDMNKNSPDIKSMETIETDSEANIMEMDV
ncbi:hypothetical protein GWI33_010128 [Rhynchophorus ferrugineus]|uniref:Uncharacterized protein n=1 Tax=Rhynchophorus ferrugineus TaxID=354439 RepID=A0A834IXK8_RHYFE|nr:hypothetical protein GWI33_010128 [Rhynchophorus ferrugineus]